MLYNERKIYEVTTDKICLFITHYKLYTGKLYKIGLLFPFPTQIAHIFPRASKPPFDQ